jgi:hypothetical protein
MSVYEPPEDPERATLDAERRALVPAPGRYRRCRSVDDQGVVVVPGRIGRMGGYLELCHLTAGDVDDLEELAVRVGDPRAVGGEPRPGCVRTAFDSERASRPLASMISIASPSNETGC